MLSDDGVTPKEGSEGVADRSVKRQKLQLPRRGLKDGDGKAAPDEGQLDELLLAWIKPLEATTSLRSSYARAVWDASERVALVTTPKGAALNSMGVPRTGGLALYPEEMLYLVDKGALALFPSPESSTAPLSSQQCYQLLLTSGIPLCRYLAYSYLRKSGFVVLRHNPANWTLPQLQQSEDTLLIEETLHQSRKELQILSTEPSSSTASTTTTTTTTTTGLMERQDTMHKLHFDIYQPRKSGFKITSPGRPDFCLAVYRFDQAVPSGETLVDLLRCTAGVPLRICIDSAGTLSFLEFEIVLPF